MYLDLDNIDKELEMNDIDSVKEDYKINGDIYSDTRDYNVVDVLITFLINFINLFLNLKRMKM
jgi:hypothetical protein